MIRRPPRSTLFPYTTLFRSVTAFWACPADTPMVSREFGAPLLNTVLFRKLRLCPMNFHPLPNWLETVVVPSFDSVSVIDRKSTRLNSSHQIISYAVFCLYNK